MPKNPSSNPSRQDDETLAATVRSPNSLKPMVDMRSRFLATEPNMMKTPDSILLEFDCSIDPTINNEFYHILLGMNFLDQFISYEIKPTHIALVDKQNKIILDRI